MIMNIKQRKIQDYTTGKIEPRHVHSLNNYRTKCRLSYSLLTSWLKSDDISHD